ncbi:Galectin-7, partial [Pseudolycoriella hygida]
LTINLQTGAATRPRDDTALHLSVRPTEPVIVRNHYENKVWGTEERFGGCPINPGQPFEILILAESTAFKIAINGVHFCHFNHRFSMQRVLFVAVEGDATISSITTTGSDLPSAPPVIHPIPMPAPINPYPPSMSYPGHRPHYPPPHSGHYPPIHGHHPGHGYIPGPPPPPPYSPSPYPGHRYPYIQPRDQSVTSGSAYSVLIKKAIDKALR